MTRPISSSSRPARGALFADPGAAAVWAAIEILDETARRELLDHLTATQLVPEARANPRDAQLARAIGALREAQAMLDDDDVGVGVGVGVDHHHRQRLEDDDHHDDHHHHHHHDVVVVDGDDHRLHRHHDDRGHDDDARGEGHGGGDDDHVVSDRRLLTRGAYEDLRKVHGRRLGWPPAGTIVRWFAGTWNDALRGAGLDSVPDGDALVRELGAAFTAEEVLDAVRAYATEIGDPLPTLTGYLRWARHPKVRARPGRRPSTQSVFDRLFGGWRNVLVTAGLARDDGVGGVGHSVHSNGGGRKVFLRSGYGYSEDQYRGALREIAERLGHSPTTGEYTCEREKLLAEEHANGLPSRAFPSPASHQKRIARWDLIDAGLEPVRGRRRKRGGGKRANGRSVTEQEILVALREGFTALGHPFTARGYAIWRREQIERDRAAGRYRRLPSYAPIQDRYSTWAQACQAALDGWQPDNNNEAACT
jgi:hypothetical protein